MAKAYHVEHGGWLVLVLVQTPFLMAADQRGFAPIFWTEQAAKEWLRKNTKIEDEQDDVRIIPLQAMTLVKAASRE